jgi:DNA-directed RNA polymerase specialized sigma24 family protein
MDDDELITCLAGGDDTPLRELFARHAPMLAARLRTVLPPSDVEDVLQETFLAAWKSAKSYRPEEKAGAWLWGIARRQAALLLRSRGPAGRAPLPDLLALAATAFPVPVSLAIPPSPSPPPASSHPLSAPLARPTVRCGSSCTSRTSRSLRWRG